MKSWKTTLGGVLAIIGLALRKHPLTLPYSDMLEAIGIGLLGLSARDNNVTSESAGAKTSLPAPAAPPPPAP